MKRAAWILPSFIEGSGGYRTVFQHINEMSKEYECYAYVYYSGDYKNNKQLAESAERFYGKCNCHFILGYENIDEDFSFIIATSWLTADVVHRYKGNAKKLYFVQDYEPLFYPAGDSYLKAAGTYELGFYHITIGRWLAHKLQYNHSAKVSYYDFCADKSIYNEKSNITRENAICFIYQPDKPRRGTQLGLEALKIVKQIRPDLTIYLYGSRESTKIPFEHVNLGLVTPQTCSELYRKCKVGLCISASNPSRIPFEMMSCGLPVVDVYAENNLYDYEANTVMLAKCRAESLAQAILNILDNDELQEKLRIKGVGFMRNRNVDYGMCQFMEIIHGIESDKIIETLKLFPMYQAKPVSATEDLQRQLMECMPEDVKSIVDVIKQNYFIRKIPGIKKMKYFLRKINGVE